jgi:hypothetical protein
MERIGRCAQGQMSQVAVEEGGPQLGLETIGEGKAKDNRLKPSEEVEKNSQPR